VETPEGEKSAQFGLRGPIVKGKTAFRFNGQANDAFTANTIIAVDKDGNSLGSQVRVPTKRGNFNTAIEHSLNNNQSLYVEYQRSQTDSSNQGLGSFDLPERASTRHNDGNTARARVQGIIGKSTLHEVRFEVNRNYSEATSVTDAKTIVVQEAFSTGGAGVNNRRTTSTWELADNVDFSVGRKHQARVGALLEGGRYDTFDEQNKLRPPDVREPGGLQRRPAAAVPAAHRHGRHLVPPVPVGPLPAGRVAGEQSVHDRLRRAQRVQSHIGDGLNLMPRVGVTWNPIRNTAIRAGYGLYYDWYEATLFDQTLRLNGVSQTDLTIRYIYQTNEDGTITAAPTQQVLAGGRTQAAANLDLPYQHQASVSVERQLRQNVSTSVSYQMLRGRNQYRARDINTPVDGVRPDQAVGIITQFDSDGKTESDRVSFQTRLLIPQQRIFFNVSYTLGRANSYANGATTLPFEQPAPGPRLGAAGPGHPPSVQAQTQVPIGLGFRGMFQFVAQSGAAYNITTGRDDNNDGVINDRPAGVGRNSARGEGYWNLSTCAITRQIGFGSRGGSTRGGRP
jgi:hypothetical protein